MILFLIFNLMLHAEDVQKPIFIRDISMFRSQVVLNIYQNKSVKVGSKLTTQTATSAHHKCLLTINRVSGDTAYADATQCPGFATLRKGQQVQLAMNDEKNGEIQFQKPKPEVSAAIKNLPAPPEPQPAPVGTAVPAPKSTTQVAPQPTESLQNPEIPKLEKK